MESASSEVEAISQTAAEILSIRERTQGFFEALYRQTLTPNCGDQYRTTLRMILSDAARDGIFTPVSK